MADKQLNTLGADGKGYGTYSESPVDTVMSEFCSLEALLSHLENVALNEDCDELWGGISGALALYKRAMETVEEKLNPLDVVRVVRYDYSSKNKQAGVAGELVRIDVSRLGSVA